MSVMDNTLERRAAWAAAMTLVSALLCLVVAVPLAHAAGQDSNEKESVPRIVKQVRSGDGAEWADAVTAQAFTDVEFRIAVTFGDELDGAAAYPVEVADELPDGMEPDLAGCRVVLDGKQLSCRPSSGSGAARFDVGDVIAAGAEPGSVLELTYTASVQEPSAHAGLGEGFVNRAYVAYPGGESEKAEARVFCLMLGVSKYDIGTKGVLGGAGFTLRDADGRVLARDGSWVDKYDAASCEFVTGDDGTLVLWGIGEGSYELVESSSPQGYGRLDRIIALDFEVDEPARGLTARVDHDFAELRSVDAKAGLVDIGVANAPGTSSRAEADPFAEASGKGSLPKTGDTLPIALWAAAAVSGSLALAAAHRRRERAV